ncbi:MAG: DUF1800 domain-containing protein [Anaerolineae bacterium]
MSDKTLSRRDFLKGSAWAAALFAVPLWAGQLDEPMPAGYMSNGAGVYPIAWAPASEIGTVDPAVLVLLRAGFGPRPGDVERVQGMGVDAYIEQQLSPTQIDDSAMDRMLLSFTTLNMSVADLAQVYGDIQEQQRLKRLRDSQGTIIDAQTAVEGFIGLFGGSNAGPVTMPSPQEAYAILTEVIQATVLRQIFSERQLLEVMVDFWSNHFSIYILKNQDRFLKLVDDREVIRKYAFGKFRDLLGASAHSPAMLVYLDNQTNVKGVPNENYARELMELHTLGVDGGYTQADVQEVARCLTGWSVSGPQQELLGVDYAGAGKFLFRNNLHDNGDKHVLGVAIPAGGGVKDGERVLDILAGHPKTAEFISTKLVRRFVADDPPASLVAKATDTFQKTDGDIRAVVSTILHSDEFKQSFGKKVKRPLEFVASTVRALGAKPAGAATGSTPGNGKNGGGNAPQNAGAGPVIAAALRAMGQIPFMWEAPNGFPDAAGAWINSNNLLTRWNLALALVANRANGVHVDLAVPAGVNLRTPDAAVDFWAQRLLHRPLPDADRSKLIAYMNAAGSNKKAAPAAMANLVALILSSPHFQYR